MSARKSENKTAKDGRMKTPSLDSSLPTGRPTPISRKLLRAFVAATLVFSSTGSQAQFDDLNDNFAPPPPPPPASGGTTSGGGLPGSRSKTGNGKDTGVLQGEKKEKFAKAPIEDITSENYSEVIDSFDFPNADIQDIVKAISELTGKNFIIDPGVRGKITILAPTKITVAEAYKAFLSALAINGYAIVPSGAFFKIRTARNAQRDGIETYSGNYYPSADQMITKIFHLKHIQAEVVNRELRMLQSKDGELSIYPPTNSLLISDYGANIDRISRILSQLDVPGFEDQLEVIRVKFAKSKDMAELIMKIINKGEKPQAGGAFTAGVPRFGQSRPQQGNTGSAYFMVIPDDRTNSLIVTGNKAGFERIHRLLQQLDRPLPGGDGGGVNVYYVKYGDAKKIAATLAGVAKDAGPKPGGGTSGAPGAPVISPTQGVQATTTEIFGGDVKITADEGTNSLVVVASKADYETVLKLLRKIDVQRDQVYIEAIIMELRNSDTTDYQIGYFKYAGSNGARVGFQGFQGDTLNGLISPVGGNGVILPFGDPNSTVTITPIGAGGTSTSTPITLPSLLGFINFLKTNKNANVLSTPSILTLDAQEGKISVGDKVAVGLQPVAVAAGSAPASPVPTFEEANIELKVKPFISADDGNIRMELKASVKQPSSAPIPKGLADTTQQLATRLIDTNIIVHHGDTAMLGGLMKEVENETISKVPLLGDIPILGWLFKSRNVIRDKTNLVMFLTPKIIKSREDGRKLVGKANQRRLDYIKGTGGRDPFGDKLDELMGVQTGKMVPADSEKK